MSRALDMLARIVAALSCCMFVLCSAVIWQCARDYSETVEQAADPAHDVVIAKTATTSEKSGLYDIPATEYAYYIPPELYTDADAESLAKMAWGEARGVKEMSVSGGTISSKAQQAATMWCALNRYDAGGYESIAAAVAAPNQFDGYDPDNPLDMELLDLAYDVLDRWELEQTDGGDVGRVLPADYLFFTGDGKHNHFRKEFLTAARYAWELPDVYAEGL